MKLKLAGKNWAEFYRTDFYMEYIKYIRLTTTWFHKKTIPNFQESLTNLTVPLGDWLEKKKQQL